MSKERLKDGLKIGVVVDQLLPGGVQIAAIEEVKNLIKLGYQAELLILMRKKYSFQFAYLTKGIPHQYLSDSYPWPFYNTIKFPIFAFFSTLHLLSPFLAPRVIKNRAYDLLISHGTSTCFTALALWRKRRIPYLAVIHDPIVYILKKVYSQTILRFFFPLFIPLSYFLERAFVKEALSTIIVSDAHQNFIQKNYQIDPTILHHGCHVLDKIPPKRGNSILAVSRWQKEKNPHLFLEIIKQIPDAKLKIAGVWTNEKDLADFKQEIQRLKLEKSVKIMPGFTPEQLIDLFRQARVWIHPHFEAFGLGALEAAANGVPIILPAGSGVTELFQHGIEGFFPKRTTLSEYLKYIKILSKDERLAYRMGRNAWLKVKKEHSWMAHTKKLVCLGQEKLKTLNYPKITTLELGHAGHIGLAGGDRLFEEMVKRTPKDIFNLEVITSPYGHTHWQEANTSTKLIVLSPNPFEKSPAPAPVFLSYTIRIAQTSLLFLKKIKNLKILYSSTNVLPDIFPAFIAKLINPKIFWIARIHHLIPPPHQREGKLIVNIVSYFMQLLSLFCLRTKADLTIALNETLYRSLLKIGFKKERLVVLGAGIDFEGISQHQIQKQKGYEGIYLGRLHVTKGVFDTIDIWEKVSKKYPEAKLAIIGGGPEIVKEQLKEKIKEKHLDQNIKVLGYLPEKGVYDYLKSAKIFLFTDHEAGWGIAIAEAMACKVPVIGWDVGVLDDVFKKGYIKIPCFNKESFAEAIINLLENREKRAQLSSEAFSQAKNLSWEKTTEKFVKMISSLSSLNLSAKEKEFCG